MGITNKAISTKFLNIIIRTKHGQTEIDMQHGGLWSSITCVTTSCSIDSFAFPTHRTNQSLDKGLWDVVPHVHKVRRAAPVMFQMDYGGGEHVYRVHLINVQLVTDPVQKVLTNTSHVTSCIVTLKDVIKVALIKGRVER